MAENICLSNVLLGHTFVSYVYECTLLLILRFPGGLGVVGGGELRQKCDFSGDMVI